MATEATDVLTVAGQLSRLLLGGHSSGVPDGGCASIASRPSHRVYEEAHVPDSTYPVTSRELAERRKEAAPAIHDAFQAFSRQVFADGALPEKTKQLIAVAVAHVTQCPYCIRSHTRLARRRGATEEEVMEAIWVAAEMRAGGAYAHSVIALDALEPRGDQTSG
jgi:AhpD family alkylhydroperoxidase